MRVFWTLIFFLFIIQLQGQQSLPKGFIYVKDIIPDIILDVRYAGTNNFLGTPVTGYHAPRIILTEPAARALQRVQEELKDQGYCIKVFDAYRPQRAVEHFIKWARDPADTLMKRQFYPDLQKNQLFKLGYIATKSGHSRGSTIDLTMVNSDSGEAVDMGSSYDFFGEISHYNTTAITKEQKENREILRRAMSKYGFYPYSKEWWHFTYRPEMFPNTYFDFVVK